MLPDHLKNWLRTHGVTLGLLALLITIPVVMLRTSLQPTDDARRYCAHAVTGRPYSEVMMMDPSFQTDGNPGWNSILTSLHRITGADQNALLYFSVLSLFALTTATILYLVGSPLAAIWALGLIALFDVNGFYRLCLGRPLVITLASTYIALRIWDGKAPFTRKTWLLTVALSTISSYVHGVSSPSLLLTFPILVLAGPRKAAGYFTAWTSGMFCGAALTGHPINALIYQFAINARLFNSTIIHPDIRASEIQHHVFPWYEFLIPVVICVALRLAKQKILPRLESLPFLAMAGFALGGTIVFRLWLDYGLPCFITWTACQFATPFKSRLQTALQESKFVLWVGGIILLFGAGLHAVRPTAPTSYWWWESTTPADWKPQPGAVAYNNSMCTFYTEYFNDPRMAWKSAIGFEPTLAPETIQRGYAAIQTHPHDPRSYESWVKLLQPQDRLLLSLDLPPPNLKSIEWRRCNTNFWIGRLSPNGSAFQ